MAIAKYFPTTIFTDSCKKARVRTQLLREVHDLAELDKAGITWSRKNYKNGYTSYASANQLQKISPTFAQLEGWIDSRVAAFVRAMELDLGSGKLKMTNCWANVMGAHSHHGLHLHPLAVISGTFYLSVPPGAPAIKFEDPRLSRLMHAPPRKQQCRKENRLHVEVPASPGGLVLFESWLRHEVPMHVERKPRVSISFNYDWV